MRLDKLVRLVRAAAMLLLLAPLPLARAALTIEIIGGGANQFPVAIVPFRAETGLPQPLTSVIEADLGRSGLFRVL